MVKNSKMLERFEQEVIKNSRLPYRKAMRIFEAIWEEAKNLGILPPKEPLESVEVEIRIAKILNSCSKNL